jgi:hypothetical protein
VWYDGYLLDVLLDPDSRIVTEINLLPAGGDEAADAVTLIRQEEQSQGNDVQALSIDGAGFNGPMLRELEDPEGLAVNTFVPPKKEPDSTTFTPADFVQDGETGKVRCPAGQASSYRQRDAREHGWIHRFKRSQCESCPLLSRCMSHAPTGVFGKTVRKNDYEAEYQHARQKAKTAAYTSVRKEHPMVERKLGEILNRHGGRRTRYWGPAKTLIHELMATLATNVKELVRWFRAPTAALRPEC